MSSRKLAVLAAFVLIGMVAAAWLGVEHRDDVRALLCRLPVKLIHP